MALPVSDVSTVFVLLRDSLNADQTLRGQAVDALSHYESRPLFCSSLMEIITEKDLASHVGVRLLALIYLKNTIKRYWKNSGICNEEKKLLRRKLLSHLREENDEIAQKLASLISKIARFDYPRLWPELFSDLAQQLKEEDILISYRSFQVLYRIFRKLSAGDSRAVERKFAEVSFDLFECCWHLWNEMLCNLSSAQFFSIDTSVGQQDLHITCERWLLCSNIILHLILVGFQDDVQSVKVPPVKEVCSKLLGAVKLFLPYYSKLPEAHPKLLFIQSACVKLMKFFVRIQHQHPYYFSEEIVLKPILEFCLNKIMDLEPVITPPFEQFLVECMVMVKSVLEFMGYKSTFRPVVHVDEVTALKMKKNISNVVALLLPSERVELLCGILIKRYFLLTTNDLVVWSQNPEGFYQEQNMLWWTMEKLRPCAEELYSVLFRLYRQLLGPLVLSILHEAMKGFPGYPAKETDTTSEMLFREAAYTAAGCGHYGLSDKLNFNDWFEGVLSPEIFNDHPIMRTIHRKIAFILGRWNVEIQGDMRKRVFGALIRLLTYEDLAVRLAACRSLIGLVGNLNFDEEGFMVMLLSCWEMCFKLLEDVKEDESKGLVLTLSFSIIEVMGEKVIPFAKMLVDFFQKAWEESSGSSVLQIQVLVALCDFIKELGIHSPVCYNMLLPILKMCIDVNNPDELDLLKYGMLLWESAISNAPLMVPQLLEFFPYLLAVMEKSFDNFQNDHFKVAVKIFKVAIKIFEGYIILGKQQIWDQHSPVLAQILDGVVGNVNDKELLATLPVIEILMQKLIVICLSGGGDCDLSEASVKASVGAIDPSKVSVKASVGAILARFIVMEWHYFTLLTREPSLLVALQQAGVSADQNINLCLADLWIDEIDNMTAAQRKICALALSFVLVLEAPEVLDKLDQILSVCTSVLSGECDEDVNGEDSSMDASSILSLETLPTDELRRRQIRYFDPIQRWPMERSIIHNLRICMAGCPSDNATFQKLQQTLNAVDP